jgi:hypothetical protein
VVRTELRFDARHGIAPRLPRRRRLGVTGLLEDVGPIEEQTRIDVPRHRVRDRVDDVGVEDPRKVVGSDDRGVRHPLIHGFERTERHEFGDPRVADLKDVWHGVADVGRQQLLVRRTPRNLLHPHADARRAPLELADEILHDFALAPHRPELDDNRRSRLGTTDEHFQSSHTPASPPRPGTPRHWILVLNFAKQYQACSPLAACSRRLVPERDTACRTNVRRPARAGCIDCTFV